MKLTKSELMGLLRKFELANDDTRLASLSRPKLHNPSTHNTAFSFRLHEKPMFLLIDETADGDLDYVLEQVNIISPGFDGSLATYRQAEEPSTSAIFKRKTVYIVTPRDDILRLDVRLSRDYPETSRSTWQKHIKNGHVKVDGTVISSSKQSIEPDAVIRLDIPEGQDKSDHMLPIIYIDDDVIVVDKPAGVLTHSKGELNDEFTVADFFSRYTSYKLDTNRPGIVHRLDRDTSGVIIGARTPEVASSLQRQFSQRKVKKTYRAIIQGHPKLEEALIDLPIGRNPSAPSTFRVDPSGKSAETVYSVLSKSDSESLVELKPKTGRTHQLRVHMSHIKNPIVGDRVYGVEAERLYLHAYRLEVTLPGGKRTIFTSPIPEEFEQRHPNSEQINE